MATLTVVMVKLISMISKTLSDLPLIFLRHQNHAFPLKLPPPSSHIIIIMISMEVMAIMVRVKILQKMSHLPFIYFLHHQNHVPFH